MREETVKILLIEDDPGDLFYIKELFSEDGNFIIDSADSLSKGLKKIQKGDCNIILLDLTLPDSKGIETFAKVYKDALSIPVVILTGLDDREVAVKAVNMGAQDYLPKQNLDTGILIRSVRYALERHTNLIERRRAEEELKVYSKRLKDIVSLRTKELVEAQEKLIRQEKLAIMGQLSGAVAHELRNPLGVISNAVYFLKMTLDGSNELTQTYMDIIEKEVSNSNKIISDLLDFSRIKPVMKDNFNLAILIDHLLKKQKFSENINIIKKIKSDFPFVKGDMRQIEQVLFNLILNSIQAMPDGGELEILIAPIEKRVKLSIKDNGIGISEENMEKIFEPLFTTKARGIGLGLSVVKNLLEVNDGEIFIESKEGKGLFLQLSFPEQKKLFKKIIFLHR